MLERWGDGLRVLSERRGGVDVMASHWRGVWADSTTFGKGNGCEAR